MIPRLEYLAWARERYHDVKFDLASSGIPFVTPDDLQLTTAAMIDADAPEQFRLEISKRFKVSTAEVTPALGTSGALYIAARALIAPGDLVAVESPGYEPLVRVGEGLGARVVRFARVAEQGYAIDPDAVMHALGAHGKLAIVTDLHNPTGIAADRETLRALAGKLETRGGHLLVDEVYRDFLVEAEGVVTARTLGENVVAIASLTKVYGVGWARAGWVLGPKTVCRDAEEAGYHTVGNYGALYAAAGVATIARMASLRARAGAIAEGKLDTVDAWVRSRDDVSWVKPRVGVFGFVRMKRATTARALIDGPCAPRGVLVADGAFFDDSQGFRIGCTAPAPVFQRGLELLGEALDEKR